MGELNKMIKDIKYLDSRKRLENVAFKNILQGTNIETSFGREFIINMQGSEEVGDLELETVIQSKIGNKKALIYTSYFHIERDKSSNGIFMQLSFEGEPKYNKWMERVEDVDSVKQNFSK